MKSDGVVAIVWKKSTRVLVWKKASDWGELPTRCWPRRTTHYREWVQYSFEWWFWHRRRGPPFKRTRSQNDSLRSFYHKNVYPYVVLLVTGRIISRQLVAAVAKTTPQCRRLSALSCLEKSTGTTGALLHWMELLIVHHVQVASCDYKKSSRFMGSCFCDFNHLYLRTLSVVLYYMYMFFTYLVYLSMYWNDRYWSEEQCAPSRVTVLQHFRVRGSIYGVVSYHPIWVPMRTVTRQIIHKLWLLFLFLSL